MTDRWLYQIRAEPVLPEALRPEEPLLKWFQPLSEPSALLRTRSLRASLQQSLAWHTETPPAGEVSTPDKWYQALSEPPRPAAALLVAAAPFSTIDPDLLTQPEQTLVSKWFNPLAEPLRAKLWLHVSLQREYTSDAKTPAAVAEEITLDKWYRALSEPIRPPHALAIYTRPALDAAGPPAGSWDSDPLITWDDNPNVWNPEIVTLEWFESLSEPVRFVPRSETALRASGGVFQAEPDDLVAPVLLEWFQSLKDPIELRKPTLPVALQPAFFPDTMLFKAPWVPEDVLGGAWVAEAAAGGAWTPESAVSGAWVEEDPEC